MLQFNPLNHSICFAHPLRSGMSPWIGHVPFGMYIIDLLRPKTLAELGTDNGVSYGAFCQAVKELGLETRCYAIDTLQGDAERESYGPEVLADLEEHHNPLYGSFSRLIQGTLDEALNSFADATLDLLNIDGYHTYEELKSNFEKWLPKMTDRGVVLFHDINVREGAFGVAKFWDELKLQYPNFEFVHSHGLGVLAVGHSYPEELHALLQCSEAEAMSVRRFFSTLGGRLEALQELQHVKTKLATFKTQTQTLNDQVRETTQRISALTTQLENGDPQIREKRFEITALKAQLEDLMRQQGGLQSRTTEHEGVIRGEDLPHSAINQPGENHHEPDAPARQIAELKKELKNRDLKLESAALQIRNWERRTQELAHLLGGVEDMRHTGSYRLVRALSAPLRWKYRKRLAQLLRRANGFPINRRLSLNSQTEKTPASVGISTKTQIAEKEFIPTTVSESGGLSDAESCMRENLWVFNNAATRETALFDAEWYLREYPDVAQAKADPLVHYLRWGANEGRAPHPLFDPKFYMTTYPEAAMGGGANALKHYLTQGWTRGYKPNPKFDPSFYLTTYEDIAQAGAEPLTHFVTNGLREGRCGCPEDVYIEPFEAAFEIPREPTRAASTVESDVKAIAFYLPQFHPIPENDEWWGTGFTEWTNVRRGEPQFGNHYQPHVPHDLNYYDLRETDVLERQVALAQKYGIHGFCFYYYWFVGKILLDLPIRRMLERGTPDFPFCICWANENWTRRWDGQENEILIGQQHSPEDDLAFLHNIENILLHKNYIRVEGKPLLIVYQLSILPDARATAARWRDAFRARGHGEIFLAAAQTFANRIHPDEIGFDAVIQFPPHAHCLPITTLTKELKKSFSGRIYDYNQTKWSFIDELYQLSSSRRLFPGVMPSWDNTARRRNKSNIWVNSSPESYYDWLSQVTSFLRRTRPDDDKLVFINAWNEWAEGCHLEPDQIFGYSWLNATRLALQSEEAAPE